MVERRQFLKNLGIFSAALISSRASAQTINTTPKKFNGKVVLITGGNSGIGEGAVRAFAAEGAHVFFCARREELGKKVEKEVRASGGEATYFKADISKEAEVKAFCEACVAKYGSIDIAFNNAGVSVAPTPLHLSDTENFEKVFNTNAKGLYFCLKYEIQQMTKQKQKGRIINNASYSSFRAEIGQTMYSSSKHAVAGLSKGAALEYAKEGIIIDSINPYCVDTPMTRNRAKFLNVPIETLARRRPSQKMTTVEEVAELVMFLASPQNRTLLGAGLDMSLGVSLS